MPAPHLRDVVQPFQIERPGLRGRLVRIGPALAAACDGHAYPEPVAELLGEAMAMAVVLASALKYDGIFTLQTAGDGPVGLIVADVTGDGALRGYARFDPERVAQAEADEAGAPVPRLLGAGHLAFTVDQGPDTERYQGVTVLEGATMSECAHAYFRRSEQLETAIVLAADVTDQPRAAALMVQRLPRADEDHEGADDDWRRAVILASTASGAELLDPGVAAGDLLFRLFHEDGVRLFRERPLRHACRCSPERVARTLAAFPRDEILAMAEDGRLQVTCEFCKRTYELDPADLDAAAPSNA